MGEITIMRMIYFSNEQEALPVTYKLKMLMRRAVVETLLYEHYQNPCDVSITFTDDEKIRKMNSEYRGIDRATDVLSFPMIDFSGEIPEPTFDEPRIALGDIVISLERAKAQADLYGHSYEREAAFLCVHSMLHLLGYDHETGPEDELDMRARQRAILSRMGLEVPADGTQPD